MKKIQRAIAKGNKGSCVMYMDAGRAIDLPETVEDKRLPNWLLASVPDETRRRLRPDILLVDGIIDAVACSWVTCQIMCCCSTWCTPFMRCLQLATFTCYCLHVLSVLHCCSAVCKVCCAGKVPGYALATSYTAMSIKTASEASCKLLFLVRRNCSFPQLPSHI